MKRERILSIVISVLAFVVAGAAGIWLTGQIAAGQPLGTIVGNAALALIPVTLLIAGGIYLYVRSANDDVEALARPMLQIQRDMMRDLRERGSTSLEEIARRFDITPDEVVSMVHQLVALDLFSGYLHQGRDVLHLLSAEEVAQLEKCRICDAALTPLPGVTQCATCGAEYFLGQ